MKNIKIKIFLFILIFGILSFSGCNKKSELFSSDAVAYPMKEDRLKTLQLSRSSDFYAENLLSFTNTANETVLRIYSSSIEDSENLITQDSKGYSCNGTYTKKNLPDNWFSNNPISITQMLNFAEITPVTSGKYTAEQKENVNLFGQCRDTVVYKDAFDKGIDLNCSVTSFGVNLEINFIKRPKKNTYQIKLKLPDLVPDTGSPDYILFKTALEKGEIKTILESPLAADKSGKWSYDNAVRLVAKESETGTYTVEYTVDEAFLANKSTKYPVKVSQSVSLYKSKQPDTSAYENTGDEAGHFLSPYMLLGDSTFKGEGWTFVRFESLNKLNIPVEKIISAKYVFRNLFNTEKEIKIGAYAVTNDWCSINTRWFNRPTYDEKPIDQVVIQKAADYSLDITSLFREMIKNKNNENAKYSVRNSFFIKSDTPDSNLIFPSGDGGLFSPYLEVVLGE